LLPLLEKGTVTETWQPLALAGLGAFHGLNPAMGWLFAVALGLHRQSRTVVFVSLLPIAGGHALSVAAVAGLLVATGTLLSQELVRIGSGLLLLAWAAYHWRFGHRHRVRVGMQTGMWGLGVWSFLMATAHGAGLMLWPALIPSCLPGATSDVDFAPFTSALAGVGLHTLAMIAMTAVIAALIYEWLGLAPLRHAWLNIDMAWLAALVATGAFLLFT
jgi:hypothetical protein